MPSPLPGKARFDRWRSTRKYNREPVPAELREAALEISRRYPRALVRRVLKIDPWRFDKSTTKKSTHPITRKKRQAAFFKLATDAVLHQPISVAPSTIHCRLQFERPDGSRLTLTLPNLDLASINRIAADFLRDSK